MPVKVKPGMSRCAVTRQPSILRNSCASASVTTFTPGLRDIVGRVAGRTGDALLRAGVDDRRVRSLRDHVGREGLHAVDRRPRD